MTLSLAWIRYAGNNPELIFASDSRLTGGGNVDHCQKVFALPREDCCIAFAGSTLIAYPFILQLQNIITEYKKAFDRAIDIIDLKGRLTNLLNRFVGAHEGTLPDEFEIDLLGTSFLFGGWSWRASKFYIWRIFYDKVAKRYVDASTGIADIYKIPTKFAIEVAFIGDYLNEFVRRLQTVLEDKLTSCRKEDKAVRLDYEPLAVLSQMLSDLDLTDRHRPSKGLIGGGPQVIKVYPFLRTLTYAVEWESSGKFGYVIKGRSIADFEVFNILGINPFTGKVSQPVRERASEQSDASATPDEPYSSVQIISP